MITQRYQRLDELGKGGMGTVYLVRDKQLNTYWAMKAMPRDCPVRDRQAFEKEVAMLSKLRHPAIPRIVDRDQDEHYDYVIMDLVEGITMSEYVKQEGAICEEQAIEWMRQLLDILAYLHQEHIIFADVKLENIMLSKQHITLIDFGIAQEMSKPNKEQYGTHGYAAPELYCGLEIDERADIYAAGKSMIAMLCGDVMVQDFKDDTLQNLKISPGLYRILKRSTMAQRKDRYESIGQIQEDLQNVHHMKLDHIQKTQKRKAMQKYLMITSLLLFLVSLTSKALYLYLCKQNYEEAMLDKDYEVALSWNQDQVEPYHRIYEQTFTSSFQNYQTQDTLEIAIAKAKSDALKKMEDYDLTQGAISKDYEFYDQLGKDCFISGEERFYEKAAKFYFPRVVELTKEGNAEAQSYLTLAEMLVDQDSMEEQRKVKWRESMKFLIQHSASLSKREQGQNLSLLSQMYANFMQDLETEDYLSWQTMLEKMFLEMAKEKAIDASLTREFQIILLHQYVDSYYYHGNFARYEQEAETMKLNYGKAFAIIEACERQAYVDESLTLRSANMYLHLFQASKDKREHVSYLEQALMMFDKVLHMKETHPLALAGKKDCERLMSYWRET